MQTRREFLGASAVAATALASGALRAANRPTKDDISLAAWSINRSFFAGSGESNRDTDGPGAGLQERSKN